MKRLFVGVAGMRDMAANLIRTEVLVGWYVSVDEARGATVSYALDKWPKTEMIAQSISDITDLASKRPD